VETTVLIGGEESGGLKALLVIFLKKDGFYG
jgi:hypothetical protein